MSSSPLSLTTSSSLLSTSSSMMNTSGSEGDACFPDLTWVVFLVPGFVYYFAVLLTIFTFRIFVLCLCSNARAPEDIPTVPDDGPPPPPSDRVTDFCTRLTLYGEELLSGQTTTGRIIVILLCHLNIASFIIYLVDATNAVTAETCGPWKESTSQQVDFFFNIYFLHHHFIRLVAAENRLLFLHEWNSVIDYLTIAPCFVGIYFDRHWLGLRFLRAFGLMKLSDVLQYLNILKSTSSIVIVQMLSTLFSVFLASAGFIHLLELPAADIQIDESDRMTYFKSFYYVIDTASRVGTGDVSCRTTFGQAFTIVFIFISLTMVAAFFQGPIQEVLESRQTSTSFKQTRDRTRHVVVCGHITYESISKFIYDFLHEDRRSMIEDRWITTVEDRLKLNIQCVIIDSKSPDRELTEFFKLFFNQIVFVKGSIMNIKDFERVRLRDAHACVILANQGSQKQDSDDAMNIMRVMSVKTCHPNIRVIVQLHCYHNKSFCVNLPSWTSLDQVLCLSELKLGFMAVGCLAPGFSTLLANLFVMRSYRQVAQWYQLSPWHDLYLYGGGLGVYAQPFSAAFHGLPFPEANKICYIRLKLLLVAITITSSTISPSTSTSSSKDKFNVKVVLNPSHDVIIDDTTLGFFICQSEDEARQVTYFCPRCHNDQQTPGALQRCLCTRIEKMVVRGTQDHSTLGLRSRLIEEKNYETSSTSIEMREFRMKPPSSSVSAVNQGAKEKTNRSHDNSNNGGRDTSPISSSSILALDRQKMMEKEDFDSTAHFHWSSRRTFEESLLSSKSNREALLELRDHVIVCCHGDDDTPFLGLVNFLMPLRASNLHRHELMPIVLLGDGKLLEREWHFVSQFPLVYNYAGSPLNQSNLRKVRTDSCRMCVILTRNDPAIEDPYFMDKEAILCSLNVRTMTFRTALDTLADPQRIKPSSYPTSPVATTSFHRRSLSLERDDEELLDVRESPEVAANTSEDRRRRQRSTFIPMLTELANEENVRFLDEDDDDLFHYITKPFASGRTFTVGILDAFMSTVYYNPSSLDLIRAFVTGGQETPRTDDDDFRPTAEGSDKLPTYLCQMPPSEVMEIRKRSRLTLLPLQGNSRLQPLTMGNYGELVVEAMSQFGILCLGLYRRQMESSSASAPAATAATAAAAAAAGDDEGGEGDDDSGFIKHRYVITNPPPNLPLVPSDKVYCLEPFPC